MLNQQEGLEKRNDVLSKIKKNQGLIEELEAERKKRWYEVKDFIDGNDKLKMDRFEIWVRKTYNKQMSSLKAQKTKLNKELEEL